MTHRAEAPDWVPILRREVIKGNTNQVTIWSLERKYSDIKGLLELMREIIKGAQPIGP